MLPAKRKSTNSAKSNQSVTNELRKEYTLGVDISKIGTGNKTIATYENSNYGVTGAPKSYNIDTILMNKQQNIYQIYDLMNFYLDEDPIFYSVIKNVLVPFSVVSGYKLESSVEKNSKKFQDYFDSIGLEDLIEDCFYETYLFGQIFLYDRGSYVQVLPPRRIRISSISISGQPILEYNISCFTQDYTMSKENYIKTVEKQYSGYPQEIIDGIKNGDTWVQLNPENTYVIQMPKSGFEKYAMPIGVSCLKSFAKKTLISEYENSLLNIGAKSFLHVQVGDKDVIKTVDGQDLKEVGLIFKNAINGFPLAVTSWNASAKFIQMDTKTLFDKSKYNEVNSQILSGLGISPIIATGDSSSSNFASASINVGTTEKRIKRTQNKVRNFILWLMNRRAIDYRIANDKIPDFNFNDIDLKNDSSFKDEIIKIYQQGLISKETTINELGYNFQQEKARKQKENSEELDNVFTIPKSFNIQSSDDTGGAPEKPGANKDKSSTGKQPKPSTS